MCSRLHRAATLRDLHENEAWPYFDTFNLHHYERFDAYPQALRGLPRGLRREAAVGHRVQRAGEMARG